MPYLIGLILALAVALAAHGAFDVAHHRLIVNPGVPDWWPAFCLMYDIAAAGYLVGLLTRASVPATVSAKERI